MKMILVTAALFLSVGGAFAGSDHCCGAGAGQQPAIATDAVHTGSTGKADNHAGVPHTVLRPTVPDGESGRGIWGR